MNNSFLPWVVDAQQLSENLGADNLCIIDLCKPESYAAGHVPGAIYIEYKNIIAARPPVMGLLPDTEGLQKITASLGLTPDTHVVAYDDEGGGKAARLLWTLDCIGHQRLSILNGGIHAWTNEGYTLEKQTNQIAESQYPVGQNDQVIAETDYILKNLKNDSIKILDTRSTAEYSGEKKYAQHGGHIPGAINMDWIMVMDQNNNLKLKPETELRDMFETLGITPDKTIVAYCHTNHRSALVYYVLKTLGYPDIKAYPGSWSEWGNRDDTPIEN